MSAGERREKKKKKKKSLSYSKLIKICYIHIHFIKSNYLMSGEKKKKKSIIIFKANKNVTYI